jgi:hypothetical protein
MGLLQLPDAHELCAKAGCGRLLVGKRQYKCSLCNVEGRFHSEASPRTNRLCALHGAAGGEVCDACMDPTQQPLMATVSTGQPIPGLLGLPSLFLGGRQMLPLPLGTPVDWAFICFFFGGGSSVASVSHNLGFSRTSGDCTSDAFLGGRRML